MQTGNYGRTANYDGLANYGGNTYRSWLQNIANSGGGVQAQEANALLQVVGDDARVNEGFLNDSYAYTGNDRGQISVVDNEGENYWYGPQGVSRLNSIFSDVYGRRGNNTLGPSSSSSSALGRQTGSGSAPQSTWTPAQQSLYEMSVAQANRNLGRIPGQLRTAQGNIQNQYNQRYNTLESARGQAKQDFTDSSTRNRQNYLTDQNNVNAQGAQTLRGLLRQLGAMGGGGGSAYLYSAPEAVGEFVQQQLSGAGQDFAGNEQQLTTTYNRFQGDSENQEKQLNDWRTQQQQEAQTQAEQQKITLREMLSQLAGQRALALNQNAQPVMQPQISAIEAAQNRIDQLQAFNPTFTGETPVYSAPELSRFMPDTRPQIDVRGGNQGSRRTPYLDVLLGRRQREENQPIV